MGRRGSWPTISSAFCRARRSWRASRRLGYMLRRLAARNRAVVLDCRGGGRRRFSVRSAWRCGSGSVAVRAQARAEQRVHETSAARQRAHLQDSRRGCAARGLDAGTRRRSSTRGAGVPRAPRGRVARRRNARSSSCRVPIDRLASSREIPNTANLGNREEALKQYEKARRLGLPLGLKSDASAGAISNLVSVDMLIADLVKRRSGIEAGAVFTQEAVEQAQRVVRISASSRESRTLLGRALFSQAICTTPARRRSRTGSAPKITTSRIWRRIPTIASTNGMSPSSAGTSVAF